MQGEDIDMGPWRVVVNHEDQYSIWPASLALPSGWRATGREGGKPECLELIRTAWTDLAPRSLRAAPGVAR
jgi:MbtH protein